MNGGLTRGMRRRSRGNNTVKLKTSETFVLVFILLVILTVGFITMSIEFEGRWYNQVLEDLDFKKDSDFDYDLITPFAPSNGSVKQYKGCPIPQLDPFDKSVEHLLATKPPGIECKRRYPLLFNSTLHSTIVPAKEYEFFKQHRCKSCCYRTVEYKQGASRPDEIQVVSATCHPLSLSNETVIPPEHEFIIIYCLKVGVWRQKQDVHAFAPLKNRSRRGNGKSRRKGKMNVVVFGMEGVSRLNFIRTMPESYSYLKNELDGVEMLGYNKVGEDTFSNLIPMLTSKHPSDLDCLNLNYTTLDDCPFIWKKYANKGYYTSFAEDVRAPDISIFNWNRPGFSKQPTNYYLPTLSQWATSNLGSSPSNEINSCFGPRLTFQYLLNYMEKLAHTMSLSNQSFFHFSWGTGLAHGKQAGGFLGDPHLLKSLKWMKQSGHLNNTVFILLSDHGYQSGEFRTTIHGELENRLPLMFFVFPESFKMQHEVAYSNLLSNGDKLVTTFDLYQTLYDLRNPKTMEQRYLDKDTLLAAAKLNALPRGISLFNPIIENRTCEMAGIKKDFCSCTYIKQTSLENPTLQTLAKIGVDHINNVLRSSPRCTPLKLKNVTLAQHTGKSSTNWEGYIINFDTKPGGGQFKALIGRLEGVRGAQGKWQVQGSIARTNRINDQSHCVNDIVLKSYCHCRDNW